MSDNEGQYCVSVKWGRTNSFPTIHGPYRSYSKAFQEALELDAIGEKYSDGGLFEFSVEVIQMVPGSIDGNQYADWARDYTGADA